MLVRVFISNMINTTGILKTMYQKAPHHIFLCETNTSNKMQPRIAKFFGTIIFTFPHSHIFTLLKLYLTSLNQE